MYRHTLPLNLCTSKGTAPMKRLLYLLTIALTITTFSYKGYTERVITNGLVSYWTFDRQDIRGDSVKDVWGENDAKIVGAPKIVGGRVGEALEFNGSDDYVNLTNLGDFGSQVGTSTFEAWVKTNLKEKRWTTLFKVRDADCAMGWGVDLNGWAELPDRLLLKPANLVDPFVRHWPNFDEKINFTEDVIRLYLTYKRGQTGCQHETLGWRFPISDGEWHHLVYVKGAPYVDEDRREWKETAIFIDGKRQWLSRHSIRKGKPHNFIPFTESVYLGAGNNRGEAEAFFNGIIDEVRIYNRPLTIEEVTQNFKLSVEATEKLPILWGTLKAAP